jgi:hypothetical protein
LAELLPPPFYVLYILHTPRGEGEAGRYQSNERSLDELSGLLSKYSSFFSSDGRHDLWGSIHPTPAARSFGIDTISCSQKASLSTTSRKCSLD